MDKAQCHPSEVEGEGFQFLEVIRLILLENNVYHAMDFKNTINSIGAHTVNICRSKCDPFFALF